MDSKIKYEFVTTMWQHPSPGGWHFISLPKKLSKEIRVQLKWQEEGWGRMKATAQIDNHSWGTAIWFDTKMDTYLLPIKAEIRTKTSVRVNKKFNMKIWL